MRVFAIAVTLAMFTFSANAANLTSAGTNDAGNHMWRVTNNGPNDEAVELDYVGAGGTGPFVVRSGEVRLIEGQPDTGGAGTTILRDALNGSQLSVKAANNSPHDEEFETDKLQNVKRGELRDTNEAVGENASEIGENADGIVSNSEQIGANTVVLGRHEERLDNHERRITDLEGDVLRNRAGVAMAVAIGGHAFDVGPDAPFQVSVAGGTFAGDNAGSIAIGGGISRNLFINGRFSYADAPGSDDYAGVVSATYSFR